MVVKFSTMNGPTQTQLFYCCAVKMCFSKARWWNQTEGERRAALLVIMARRVAMGVGGGYLTPPPVQRSRWSGPGPLKCLFVSDYKLQRRPPRFPPQRRTSHNSASAALFSPRAPFFAIKIGRWCVYSKHFIFFSRLFLLIQLKWHHSVKDNIIEKQYRDISDEVYRQSLYSA